MARPRIPQYVHAPAFFPTPEWPDNLGPRPAPEGLAELEGFGEQVEALLAASFRTALRGSPKKGAGKTERMPLAPLASRPKIPDTDFYAERERPEDRYSNWGVWGLPSGFCYSIGLGEVEAEALAKEKNNDRRKATAAVRSRTNKPKPGKKTPQKAKKAKKTYAAVRPK